MTTICFNFWIFDLPIGIEKFKIGTQHWRLGWVMKHKNFLEIVFYRQPALSPKNIFFQTLTSRTCLKHEGQQRLPTKLHAVLAFVTKKKAKCVSKRPVFKSKSALNSTFVVALIWNTINNSKKVRAFSWKQRPRHFRWIKMNNFF